MQSTGVAAVSAFTAHREWASRPPDERFASVSSLYEAARARRERTEERIIETNQIRTEAPRHTPTIEIAIGREMRLYHAYVTTAPARLDAPATLTVHAAPLWDVLWMAAAFIALDAERAKQPGRLVLVDDSQFDWQEAKYKEARHLFTPADPVLVGLSALQDSLWNRLRSPQRDLSIAEG
jgi:hypothetical protein